MEAFERLGVSLVGAIVPIMLQKERAERLELHTRGLLYLLASSIL